MKKFVKFLTFTILGLSFWNCSSETNTAGGVTDIGNSIAGTVVCNNEISRNARVVFYSDSWEEEAATDSVVTTTDSMGHFSLTLKDTVGYLFATAQENFESSALVKIENTKEELALELKPAVAVSGKISNAATGRVRIVGTSFETEVLEDGSFKFDHVPQGEISLVYKTPEKKSHFEFHLETSNPSYKLPPLKPEKEFLFEVKDSLYSEVKMLNISENIPGVFVVPFKIERGAFAGLNIEKQPRLDLKITDKNENVLDYEIEETFENEAIVWVRMQNLTDTLYFSREFYESKNPFQERDGFLARIHFNRDERIINDKNAPRNLEGVFGNGITLNAGEFLSLDSIDPTAGDFTLSFLTKWFGPNEKHQILFSQRAYWSDTTSRFQWHYEKDENVFMVMKAMPNYPEAITVGETLPQNEWVHVALVSQNNFVTMYVNGEPLGEPQEFTPNELKEKVPFTVAGNEIDDETWNGAIDEIRIENIARSSEYLKVLSSILLKR